MKKTPSSNPGGVDNFVVKNLPSFTSSISDVYKIQKILKTESKRTGDESGKEAGASVAVEEKTTPPPQRNPREKLIKECAAKRKDEKEKLFASLTEGPNFIPRWKPKDKK